MGLGFYGIGAAMLKGANSGLRDAQALHDKSAERKRQAEQDDMRKQEFGVRMEELNYQKELRDKARGIESARLQVMKDKGAEQEQVPVIQYEGKSYEAPSLDPAALPKDTGVTGAQGQAVTGLDGVKQVFGTAAEAQAYKDQLTPSAYSIQKKLQEKFAQMPGGDAASEAAAKRAQAMQKEGMFDALRLLSAGQPDQAIKAFESVGNERIPEGAQFVAREGKDPITGAVKSVYAMVGLDGKVIIPNLHEAVYGYVLDPVKRLEMEAGTENAKVKAVNERDKFLWQEQVKAELRGQSGTSGSKSKKGNAPGTPLEQSLGMLEDSYKSENDPAAKERVRSLINDAYQFDANLKPDKVILAAVDANNNPATAAPRLVFGANAGVAMTHTNSADGTKTPLHKMPSNWKPTPEDVAGFQQDAAAFVKEQNGRYPDAQLGSVMLAAAKGEKTALQELPRIMGGIKQRAIMAANPLAKNATAEQKATYFAALDAKIKQSYPVFMQEIQQSLGLLKNYGTFQ